MSRLAFLVVLLFLGCDQGPAKIAQTDYFDLPSFTHEILANLEKKSPDASKEFILNNERETKTFTSTDSVFWSKELQLLTKTDLNSVKYRGALEVSKGNNDLNSNLLIDRFIVTSDDIDLRKVEIYYLEQPEQVRMLNLEYASKNFIAQSNSQLTIWFNEYNDQLLLDSLVLISQDKVIIQGKQDYESHVQRVRR